MQWNQTYNFDAGPPPRRTGDGQKFASKFSKSVFRKFPPLPPDFNVVVMRLDFSLSGVDVFRDKSLPVAMRKNTIRHWARRSEINQH